MAITNYSELQTAVQNWLARSNLNTYIADIVRMGELRIYRDLRIRAMETSLESTIADGVIAVPSDYLELKNAYIDGSPTTSLERKTTEWIYANYPVRSADNRPSFIAREGDNFIFAPYPDSTYTVKGIYYKRLTALSDSNTTNWFITNAPDLLLFASLCEAAPFILNDERIPIWEAKYQYIRTQVQSEDIKEAGSGSILRATSR